MQVEDLFYNVPSRQRAFRSPSEEYAKILDVVGRYAVHCSGVAFSCKKHGESGMSISTPASATTIDSIRQIHGSAVANELLDFEVSDEEWGFKACGWATNANYHVKKTTILLFINHRSVESSAVKRAIEQTYSAYLPKGGHPFCYLSLDIDPKRVDVNVHPTKREVNFLNEEEIVERVCAVLRKKLEQVDTSRTFATQSLLPTSSRAPLSANSRMPNSSQKYSQSKPSPSTPVRPYENNLVRTDPNMRKITSMLPPSLSRSGTQADATSSGPIYSHMPRDRTECRLVSVKNLRVAERKEMHANLTESFASLTYVGLVDPYQRLAAMQSGVKLYLVDYGLVSQAFFYQLGLADFGNFGTLAFEVPLDLEALIRLAVETERASATDEDMDWDSVAGNITQQLISRKDMLLEYFNLEITAERELLTMPLLLKGYTPSLAKLPRFLMRLGPCVDWGNEEACFETFLRELARFHTLEQLPPYETTDTGSHGQEVEMGDGEGEGARTANDANGAEVEDGEITAKRTDMERVLEHVLFPALRARLVATKSLLRGVTEVADLKGLYRVFERC